MCDEDAECCTKCGAPCDDLTVIDDVDRVCPECLANEYIQCDVCEEYWHDEDVEMHNCREAYKAKVAEVMISQQVVAKI